MFYFTFEVLLTNLKYFNYEKTNNENKIKFKQI
jgi:hypothetical protein